MHLFYHVNDMTLNVHGKLFSLIAGEMLVPPEENAIYRHGQAFSTQVAKGLADNWSQVGFVC